MMTPPERVADADGACVCVDNHFDISGTCVAYSTLFPAAVGAFFGLILLVLGLVRAALKRTKFRRWRAREGGVSVRALDPSSSPREERDRGDITW
jgi:hypothetical protein